MEQEQDSNYESVTSNRQGIMDNPNMSEQNLKFILNTDDITDQLRIIFLRLEFDPTDNTFKRDKDVGPQMNAKGLSNCMAELKFRMNKIFNLTVYDREQISDRMVIFARGINLMFVANYRKWGIDRSNVRLLCHDISDAVEANMLKSLPAEKGGNTQELVKGNFTSREINSLGQKNKSNGMSIFGRNS